MAQPFFSAKGVNLFHPLYSSGASAEFPALLLSHWNRKIYSPIEEVTFYRGNLRLRG